VIEAALQTFEHHTWLVLWLILGWYAHLWQCAREMSRERQERIWPHHFIARRPARSALSAFGAVALYLLLDYVQTLTPDVPVMHPFFAFAAGYLSEKGLDVLREKFGERLGIKVPPRSRGDDLNDTTVMRPPEEN
jgi:hypothetical protein